MRRIAATALGAAVFLGVLATPASADDPIRQGFSCRTSDTPVDILGEAEIGKGLAAELLHGEGFAGAQGTRMGSSMECNASVGGS
ncbi:hypothetical protein [Streptomyces lanatus]|uniref:Uncharacterized protein n=1 Tax=Streptomyces lanatus TaxID=66900 RepID=A0ABV1Y3X3_9ACTN|nr:hypothetical protein [Streptomyces lanatus]GHH27551.1 hypothetical protein GCM10018780_83020 [Streptomyces lanatus]